MFRFLSKIFGRKRVSKPLVRDTNGPCEAVQYSDSMVCARGGLIWDMNDPDAPWCK